MYCLLHSSALKSLVFYASQAQTKLLSRTQPSTSVATIFTNKHLGISLPITKGQLQNVLLKLFAIIALHTNLRWLQIQESSPARLPPQCTKPESHMRRLPYPLHLLRHLEASHTRLLPCSSSTEITLPPIILITNNSLPLIELS